MAEARNRRGDPPLRLAIALVTLVAAGIVLKTLAGVLVPFALAVFVLLLVDAIARLVRTRLPGCPSWISTAAGLLVVAVAFFGSLWIIGAQASAAAMQADAIGARLETLAGALVKRVGVEPMQLGRLIDERAIGKAAEWLFAQLQGFASGTLLVAIYLGFLIATRASLGAKFDRLFGDDGAREHAARVVGTVRRGVEQYVWVQTWTGLVIAGLSWSAMALLGVGNAPLLALIVFLTSYIPVIGPALGVFVPAAFALVQFGGWREALTLLALLQGINFLINNLLVPRIQADRMNLDPTVVLLSLGVWTWLWGLPGALLSPPLTVLAMAVAAELPGFGWAGVLLSRDGSVEGRS